MLEAVRKKERNIYKPALLLIPFVLVGNCTPRFRGFFDAVSNTYN
jgi:hypothetical protein